MSIHEASVPVRSRTAIAGSSGSETPRENVMPSVNSSRYASRRATRYSSDSDGCRATRSASDSYTPRSLSASSTSKLYIVACSAMSGFAPGALRGADQQTVLRGDVGRNALCPDPITRAGEPPRAHHIDRQGLVQPAPQRAGVAGGEVVAAGQHRDPRPRRDGALEHEVCKPTAGVARDDDVRRVQIDPIELAGG